MILGVVLMTLAGYRNVAAQTTTPEAIDPQLCAVAPITDTELLEIVSIATPRASSDAPVELTGDEVDQNIADSITDTIRESIACTNANEPMRGFALFTDDYLQARFGGTNQDDLGHLLAAITRQPDVAAESDRLALVSIGDVMELADGRVAATVTTENAKERFVDDVLLKETDGRWLIDEVVTGEPEPRGTPVS
jgi:hypothetical protein